MKLYDKLNNIEGLEKNPTKDEIIKMLKYYDKVVKDLEKSINRLEQSGFNPSVAKAFQKEVNTKVNKLNKIVEKWAEVISKKSYTRGLDIVDAVVKRDSNGKITLKPRDREFIKETIDKIKKQTFKDVKMVNNDMRDRLDKLAQQGIKEGQGVRVVQEPGKLGGTTTGDEIGSKIYRELRENGLKLVDSAGRKWDPVKYARMYARTRTREYQTKGTIDRMQKNELDLVKISKHVDVDGMDICNLYEGKVFAISGNSDRYPALEQRPPYHPNCAHVVTPWVEKYAKKRGEDVTKYYKDEFKYDTENGIIKTDKVLELGSSAPKTYKPFGVIDLEGRDQPIKQRVFYDKQGKIIKQIDTNPHNRPDNHPYGLNGEHAHDFEWENGELKNRTTREVIKNERKLNSDILPK